MSWEDLRILLAVARGGTLSAAAGRLKVNQTTVTRRLAALEGGLAVKLFQRVDGRLTPTEPGEAALRRAERVEAEMIGLEAELAGADRRPEGTVRLTAVPVIANRLLVPRLGAFLKAYPGLRIELVAEARNLSLTRRDCDLALRFARPQGGAMLCRRLGSLGFSLYGPHQGDPETLPWLGYEEGQARLPQAAWVVQKAAGETLSGLLSGDLETQIQAVLAGLGRGLLPDFVAAGEPGLRRLSDGPLLEREVWLLLHPDLRHLPRVIAVAEWLQQVFASLVEGQAPTA